MSYAITVVLVRLFAAFIIFQGLNLLVAYLPFWSPAQYVSQDVDSARLAQLILIVVIMVFGFVLWLFSHAVAKRVLGVAHPESSYIEADDIVAAGCFTIGLWWLIDGLWDLTSLVVLVAHDGPTATENAVGAFASVGISLMLILGVRRVVGLFRKLRHAGH